MAKDMQDITREIEALRKDIKDIRSRMVDVDMLLSERERKRLEESLDELRSGKAISHEELVRELHDA